MGLWDFLFPTCDYHPAVIPQSVPSPVATQPIPDANNCINCHQTPPAQTECSAREDWSRELYATVPSIQNHPQRYSWWQQNNHLATWLQSQQRQHSLPVQLNGFNLDVEVKPDEPNLPGAAGWVLTEDSILSGHLSGSNLSLFLNHGNLVEASDSILGGLRLFFQEGSFSTNSIILNFLTDINSALAQQIPVAYNPETHRTYTLAEYLRNYFETYSTDADLFRDRNGNTLYAEDQNYLYEGLPYPVRQSFIQVVQSMQGGETAVLIRRDAPALIRFPYLFELSLGLVTNQNSVGEIDLVRLFPEIVRALSMQTSNSHSASTQNSNPFRDILGLTDYSRVNLEVHPSRIFWNNFDVQFDPSTTISLGVRMNGSSLRSLHGNSRVDLQHLFIPGILRLGASHFQLAGHGPALNLSLNNIDLNLEPFDVSAPDLAHRGALHIASGRIEDGESTSIDLRQFRPGFHLEGDIHRNLRLTSNLNFNVSLGATQGDYDISGQILSTNRLGNLELEPGQTLLQIQHLNITNHASNTRLIEDASLTITDLPSRIGNNRSGFLVSIDIPRQHLPLLDRYRSLHLEMFVPVDRVPAENVEWMRLLDSFAEPSHSSSSLGLNLNRSSPFAFQNGPYAVSVLPANEANELNQLFQDSDPLRIFTSRNPLLVRSSENTLFAEIEPSALLHLEDDPPSHERYVPDFHLRNFSINVEVSAQGRAGVPPVNGQFNFSTNQPSSCERRYELSADMNRFSAVLGPSLELLLRHIHLAFSARQNIQAGGIHHFEIPTLEASANTRGAPRTGISQGPLRIFQQSAGGHVPIRISYDPQSGSDHHPQLDVRDLRLRFAGQNIVHSSWVDRSRNSQGQAQVSGLDVGGILRTDHWRQNLQNQLGSGLLCLRGSPSGDVFLRDEHHRRIAAPLLEDSLWCTMGVNRYDPIHQVLRGAFLLDLGIDLNVFRAYGININSSGSTGLYSDNLPLTANGYRFIQRAFFRRVHNTAASLSSSGGNP